MREGWKRQDQDLPHRPRSVLLLPGTTTWPSKHVDGCCYTAAANMRPTVRAAHARCVPRMPRHHAGMGAHRVITDAAEAASLGKAGRVPRARLRAARGVSKSIGPRRAACGKVVHCVMPSQARHPELAREGAPACCDAMRAAMVASWLGAPAEGATSLWLRFSAETAASVSVA